MTNASAPSDPPDDILAAEHALGVSSLTERALAEARRSVDRNFDDAVLAWEERLAPLAAQVAPVEPSPKVWPRIEQGISPRSGLLGAVGFWRGATAASLALAAASLLVLVMPKAPTPPVAPAPAPAPILTGFIRPEPGKSGPIIAAAIDRTRGELILTPASLEIDSSKSAELWVIPAGGTALSLGVVEAGQERRIPLPAALAGDGRSTALLAITIEQPGGSPTGVAQGPVVATGGFM
jgi:anti-sigma-K factor RskA